MEWQDLAVKTVSGGGIKVSAMQAPISHSLSHHSPYNTNELEATTSMTLFPKLDHALNMVVNHSWIMAVDRPKSIFTYVFIIVFLCLFHAPYHNC